MKLKKFYKKLDKIIDNAVYDEVNFQAGESRYSDDKGRIAILTCHTETIITKKYIYTRYISNDKITKERWWLVHDKLNFWYSA